MVSLFKKIYYSLPKGSKWRSTLIQFNFIVIYVINWVHSILPFWASSRFLNIFGMKIHHSSSIHRGVKFFSIGNFDLGPNSSFSYDCYIDNRAAISVGSCVSVAHCVKVYTTGHDINSPIFALSSKPVVIEDYVCIFANVLIMPGVILGRGCVVYPGSVVSRSVPPYAVVAGNPARVVKFRSHDLNYKIVTSFWKMQ